MDHQLARPAARRRRVARLGLLAATLALAGCGAPLPPAVSAAGAGRDFDPYEEGRTHLAAGRLGLAAARLGSAGAPASSIEALNALAATYDRLGRYDLALRYYRRALALDPGAAQTLNNLGFSYYLQGRYDLAVVLLREARLRAPDSPMVDANLRLADAALGEASSRAAGGVSAPSPAPEPLEAGGLVRARAPSDIRLVELGESSAPAWPGLDYLAEAAIAAPRPTAASTTASQAAVDAFAGLAFQAEQRIDPGDAPLADQVGASHAAGS